MTTHTFFSPESLAQQSTGLTLQQLPLSEQAYFKIKKMILENELKEGDSLHVDTLSKSLSLGRSPVYLALHRLDREGLIEIMPRKGILVKGETLHSLLELLNARALIEPHLTYLATQNCNDELLDELETLIAQSKIYHDKDDKQSGILIDRRFHQVIYKAANNNLLADFAMQLLDRSMRLWFIPSSTPVSQTSNAEELVQLFDAIKRKDPELAAEKMRLHIGSLREKYF